MIHSASSDHYFHLKMVVFCEILKSGEGRTTFVKIVFATGRTRGSASWIN